MLTDLMLLALFAFAGRVLLSFLPPGPIGSHRLADLPTTWAVCHLLGYSAASLHTVVLDALGLSNGFGILIWGALAIVRWLTLPASMVPGHAIEHERGNTITRAIWLLIAARFVALAATGSELTLLPGDFESSRLGFVSSAALVVLLDHALREGRRAPHARLVLVFVAALLLPLILGPTPELVAFGAGLVFLVPWMRRADRRACWLSLFFFAASATAGPAGPLVGVFALFASSTRTQRAYALPVAALMVVIVAIPTGFLLESLELRVAWLGLVAPAVLLLVGLRLLPLERTAVDATT